MKEIKLSLVRADVTAKSLQKDNMNHIFVRFPLLWEQVLEWLKPKTKVRLAITDEGQSITLAPIPQVEKELED